MRARTRRVLTAECAHRRSRIMIEGWPLLWAALLALATIAPAMARAEEAAKPATPPETKSEASKPVTEASATAKTTPTTTFAPVTTTKPMGSAAGTSKSTKSSTTTTVAAKPTGVTIKTASATSVVSMKPRTASKTAAKPAAVVQPMTQRDEHVTYQYNALGRRDPFESLVGGDFVSAEVSNAPPDVGGLTVVGIVWGDADKFAMVEDATSKSFVLRQGDKVMNGFVQALKRDAVVISTTVDGQTELVTVPLTRKGEKNANH